MVTKFWDGTSEGWQYGSALHRLFPNASWQELLPGLVCKWLNCLTDSSRFFASIFAKQEFRMAPPKLHKGVRIGLPELHGRIRMVWPKLHGRFRMVWPKLHGRFHMVRLKFGILYWDSICSHQICTVGVFWHTLSIMQEKHWKDLFEIEWCLRQANSFLPHRGPAPLDSYPENYLHGDISS